MKIRILIAEHHAVLRAALRSLLVAEPDIDVVGEAVDASEALCLAAALHPNVILLDISLLGQQGFGALRRLSSDLPHIQLLLLTDSEEAYLVPEALVAGAAGCVVGPAADATLIPAIRVVSQGYIYIQPDILRALLSDLRLHANRPTPEAEDLTPCEIEVVRLITHGYTNRQAAEELGLSVRTVASHREKIMAKLGLCSRAELVRYAAVRQLAGVSR